jgi:ornithine carbamoyltransferase
MRHLLSLADWPREWIEETIEQGLQIKRDPRQVAHALQGRVLLMLFQKPSLRTRLSFEVAMLQMGGHAIYYDLGTSPWGKGKESLADVARTVSRYVDAIMARLFQQADLEELAAHASVPVINGLTDHEHPCQVLGDLMTILEKKGRWRGLKLAYVGDGHNNVTHSLLLGGAKVGLNVSVGCPEGPDFEPDPTVLQRARAAARETGAVIEVLHEARAAVAQADIVYTDTWMSYHIPPEERSARERRLRPFQVTADLLQQARPDVVFMHCLPAERGAEVTGDVIDGPHSIVFDQAENRLHIQKAILLRLLGP